MDPPSSRLAPLTSKPIISLLQSIEVPSNQRTKDQEECLAVDESQDVDSLDEIKSTIKHVLIKVQAEWSTTPLSSKKVPYNVQKVGHGQATKMEDVLGYRRLCSQAIGAIHNCA